MRDYTHFKQFVEHVSEGYVWENEDQLRNIVNYFGEGETTLDRRKGIIIRGTVGVGKTLFLNLIQKWVVKGFAFNPVHEVVRKFNTDGNKGVEKYITPLERMFDDIGAEDEGRYYGNKTEVMEDVIYPRYELFTSRGVRTHFTSNLGNEDFKNKYDARIYDRLREMCTVVNWEGTESKRGESSFRFKREEEKITPITEEEKEQIIQKGMKEHYEHWRETGEIIGSSDVIYKRLKQEKELPTWSEKDIELAKEEAALNISKVAKSEGKIMPLGGLVESLQAKNVDKLHFEIRRVLMGRYYKMISE